MQNLTSSSKLQSNGYMISRKLNPNYKELRIKDKILLDGNEVIIRGFEDLINICKVYFEQITEGKVVFSGQNLKIEELDKELCDEFVLTTF